MFDVNIQWRIQHLQMGEGQGRRAEVERRWGENRGAEGCGEGRGGVSPPYWERGLGEGDALPNFFSILDLKMATLGAFWALFLQFSYLV